MVPECNLVAVELFRCFEEGFSAIPRAEEAVRSLLPSSPLGGNCIVRSILLLWLADGGCFVYERYIVCCAEGLQVIEVRLITDVGHGNMYGSNVEAGYMDFLAASEQFDQREGIFSS